MTNIKTVIFIKTFDSPLEVRESYALIKKRCLDRQDFIEVTNLKKSKQLYNKSQITAVISKQVLKKKGKKE